ncbi:MAG: 1-acyl-sn-glycerol-3-phosphate acyltransferase [Candidatus Hydrogenedentes bacterium]|nr:1-acyl-sn-glycerol-3-phosphate acyltransferase [Candidatus Hydrogenedentota bacterium]
MDKWKLEPAHDLGLPLGKRLRSLQRESGLISTGFHLAWWTLVRGYLAAWHRLRIVGREHLPARPPFVLVGNHASHLDALVLASPLPWRLRDHVFPIAAGDVFFETPLATTFAAGLLNALPMWRKKCGPHDLHVLRERLVEEPAVYILFPEGGRSRDGKMMPFKPGLGMMVAGTSVPVIPCYLDGCFEALRPNERFPRPRKLTVHIGPPLRFDNAPNTRQGWTQITAEIEAAVKSLAPSEDKPVVS